MIKLIASDLDGTLLLNGAQTLKQETLDLLCKLKKQGILFASASGRQYTNQHRLYHGEDNYIYICENGTLTVYEGEVISRIPMEFHTAMEIAKDIYDRAGCEVAVNTKDTAYLIPKYGEIQKHMEDVVHYDVTVLKSLDQIQGEILKVAMYQVDGVEDSVQYFQEKWSESASVAVSGLEWMDFMDSKANKGRALEQLQKKLGISPEETMVFGDNFNDIEMLDQAEHSYVMAHAVQEVKAHARYQTKTVEEVLRTLV